MTPDELQQPAHFDSAEALLRWIREDPGLTGVLEQVEQRLRSDPGHDVGHALRVALWTLRLGDGEVDAREAVGAALLHDVVNLPKDSPERARASELSAEVARRLLPDAGFEPPAIERMADAIRDHSFSRGALPDSMLGKALQDADRLEALGVLGIFRAISCGVELGAAYFDSADPWARSRPLDDKRFSLDHFFTKLLALPGTMQTDAGRREALSRVEFMRASLEQLGRELGEAPPVSGGDSSEPL